MSSTWASAFVRSMNEHRAGTFPAIVEESWRSGFDDRVAGVDARLMDRGIEVHAKIHREEEELHHRRQDTPATGRADREALAVGGFSNESC
jgi:hypothetical protein